MRASGAAFGIDQFDSLRHCVGTFTAVTQRLEPEARPVQLEVLRRATTPAGLHPGPSLDTSGP